MYDASTGEWFAQCVVSLAKSGAAASIEGNMRVAAAWQDAPALQ